MVREMREALDESQSVYLTAFEGLTVAEATELRGALLDAGGRMQVVKNRLLKIAIDGTDYASFDELLTGPNAVTYCAEDSIAPLKVLTEFADDHDQPPVKAGVVDGEMLSPEQIVTLSKVPSRDELMGTVVGAFAGPVYDLVYTLGGVVNDLVYTLQAMVDEQGGEEAA